MPDQPAETQMKVLTAEQIMSQSAYLREALPKKYHDFFDCLCRTAIAKLPQPEARGIIHYQTCPKHQGQPWTTVATAHTITGIVCPLCNPPPTETQEGRWR